MEDIRIEIELKELLPDPTSIEDKETEILSFALEVSDPQPEGVRVSKRNVCVIDIVPDDILGEERQAYERQRLLEYYVARKRPSWAEQFKLATMVGPSIDEDDHIIEAGYLECLVHFLSCPWKVLFAIIPPRYYLNGWPAFFMGLCFVTLLSSLIS